jgi:hypothetical protein
VFGVDGLSATHEKSPANGEAGARCLKLSQGLVCSPADREGGAAGLPGNASVGRRMIAPQFFVRRSIRVMPAGRGGGGVDGGSEAQFLE